MTWTPIVEGSKRAVAIFHFKPALCVTEDSTEGQEGSGLGWQLALTLGDVVVLREEADGWYLGYLQQNPGLVGIFPKNYVHVLRAPQDIPPLAHEFTNALREWSNHLKDKFLADENDSVSVIRGLMREILSMRSSLLSGKMTVEEKKELQMKATTKMDFLNYRLGLDLVVRDENGVIMSAERTSTVTLFRNHVKSTKKIKNFMIPEPVEEGEKSNSFKIMMSVKNFVLSKVTEEVELVMSIYEVSDGKSPKPLCENYIVPSWKRNPNDIEKRNNLRVLFADISKNDITGKRLFLICNVVNYGNFSGKSGSHSGHDLIAPGRLSKSNSKGDISVSPRLREGHFRKPVGVAAIEITDLFTFKQGKSTNLDLGGKETELSAPFLAAGENEPFENVFRKLVFDKKGIANAEPKSLWVTLNIMMGEPAQSPLDLPFHHHQLASTRFAVARKIGLPDVILPSDFRNDLYVNLIGGEFSRLDKRSDRNVEVTVEVCDSNGSPIEESISGGEGSEKSNAYHSVVFYHESKPRWNEVMKVSIQVHQFNGSHLRFTFRHRSSNTSKEKSAPWAISFLKLMKDTDQTAVRDGLHELLVYKIEKKFDFDGQSYLTLPYERAEEHILKHRTNHNLTFISKDSCLVQTTLCSTKLTQNEGLSSLLKWRDDPSRLTETLTIFNQKVNGKEFVKSLPDVLDALFSILTESKSEEYDHRVFKSLINVIHLITEDARYKQFVPVLDVYIQENFSATLAYNKLLVVLKECVENETLKPMEVIQAMKSLKYIFRFVVQSRALFAKMNDGKGREPFQHLLREVLHSLVKLMFCTTRDLFQAQSQCLHHMVQAVPDLATVFSQRELTEIIVSMVQNLPKGQLTEHKISTLKALCHSQLFQSIECRTIIMPELSSRIRSILERSLQPNRKSTVKLVSDCIETLGDVLDALHRFEAEHPGSTLEDVTILVNHTLRTVIKSVHARQDEDEYSKLLVTSLVSIFRIMSPRHYSQYIESFRPDTEAGLTDLIDFIMEILALFIDLIKNPVYSSDWAAMIELQNSVFLKAIRHIANTIRDFLMDPFVFQAWNEFFNCAVAFITQPSVQLEKFSDSKQDKIRSEYKDMRKDMAMIVKSMWFNLGQQKIRFVPGMVGPFLEMTLVPETELRKSTIPIFFDMMQCEFCSPLSRKDDIASPELRRNIGKSKANFDDFKREMIMKLDSLIGLGLGDEHFKALFKQIMLSHCSNHTLLRDSGTRFVELISRLTELLLEHRSMISTEDSIENQMSCIVNLIDFYQHIPFEEMYVKYLRKLCTLHERCKNFAEAGCTLMQLAELLEWSDLPLNHDWEAYQSSKNHRSLRERLYREALEYYNKGQIWERALQVCKELVTQYEEETYEYDKLEEMHKMMASFYKSIMTEIRPDPEYFRVAFYGRGFPAFLQNKIFVYRGQGFERLAEFQSRMLEQFPNAELMKTLQTPSNEEKEQPVQLLQINKVDPVMGENKFVGKFVQQEVLNYYKVNEVSKFIYSRPFTRNKEGSDNEFASLWIRRTELKTKYTFPGILQWFPLEGDEIVYELCPLENAIETMQRVNEELRSIILEHQRQSPPLNPLSMKLNGIIDAAVMGGTAKYEQAFFTEKYIEENPSHEVMVESLKNLIAEQIPLLEAGLKIHDYKKTDNLKDLHNRMETMFAKLRESVESQYGKRSCDIVVKRVFNTRTMSRNLSSNNAANGIANNGSSVDLKKQASNQRNVSHASQGVSALHNSFMDLRYSMVSQNSVDSNAKSRMLNAIGITRKKSNVENHRTSLNRSSNSNPVILDTSTSSSVFNGSEDDLSLDTSTLDSPTVIVTQSPSCRLQQSSYPNRKASRPGSGQNLAGFLGQQHSRSPSLSSNRNSGTSEDFPDNGGRNSGESTTAPPTLPPKNRGSDPDSISMSSIEEEKQTVVDDYQRVSAKPRVVTITGRKKAPPPPPPSLKTPPTPPKKPSLKPVE